MLLYPSLLHFPAKPCPNPPAPSLRIIDNDFSAGGFPTMCLYSSGWSSFSLGLFCSWRTPSGSPYATENFSSITNLDMSWLMEIHTPRSRRSVMANCDVDRVIFRGAVDQYTHIQSFIPPPKEVSRSLDGQNIQTVACLEIGAEVRQL